MAAQKNKLSPSKVILLVILGLAGLALLITWLLQGTDFRLFNPKGLIAQEQFGLIAFSLILLLAVAIPSVLLLYFFAWKFRDSNEKATHAPDARHGGKLFLLVAWGIPTTVMLILALIMLPATHKLDPKNAVNPGTKPLEIQVVAMRWKWIFIYPEQNIATVNFVQVPVGAPVQFDLTADEAPMSSFWIPHLAGQLYAMTGHANRLNIMAETPGDYPGSSAEINGAGFAGMKFTARVSSKEDFDKWVQEVQQLPTALDAANYATLLKPSENNLQAYYSAVETDLYDKVLMKYMGSHDHAEHNE